MTSLSSEVNSTIVYKPESYIWPLTWNSIFANVQDIELELGSGDGSFIVQWARLNPERNFFAVERLLGRLRKIERKGKRLGLANLRAIRLEAAYLLEYLVPQNSLEAIHIYFPDPWPKRKHRRKRLVNEHFTGVAHKALKLGGVVHLRTDDLDYFQQMQEVFNGNKLFHEIETAPNLQAVLTDFERTFHARGVKTLRAAYRKKDVA